MRDSRSPRRLAFTLLETLLVISIVALLAAILSPVLTQAKDAVHRSSCVGNLRQSWTAVALYRSDNDGDARYGASFDMGLPPRLAFLAYPDPGESIRHTPQAVLRIEALRCADWPSKLSNSGFSYNLMYQDPAQMNRQNRWDDYVDEAKEDAILLTDVNHNPRDIPMFSSMVSKAGFGTTVGGTLVKWRKPGDPDILRWWSTSCSADCPLR